MLFLARHPLESDALCARDLSESLNPLDVVLNVESSHCYGSMPRFLAEVRRVLEPRGYFLHADFRARSALETWQ